MLTAHVCNAVLRGATAGACALTPPIGGSSSSLSSSNDRCEFHEVVHGVDEAHLLYSDATYKVSQLEHCLEAVRVALEASERETTATWVVPYDA